MTTYTDWSTAYPEAAAALATVLAVTPSPGPARQAESEAAVQQHVRLSVARQGAYAWRNNVGATPARCPKCQARQSVIRYGLANDSTAVNKVIKTSDLILAIPRVVTTADVGRTIAQFGAIECKKAGWRYTGAGREAGQAAWLALVNKIGGHAQFSTGEILI